jgi:hypothetical protein
MRKLSCHAEKHITKVVQKCLTKRHQKATNCLIKAEKAKNLLLKKDEK